MEEFLESLSGLCRAGEIWYYLWKNGPQKFSDILDQKIYERTQLCKFLIKLKNLGLVIHRNKLYEASGPDYLIAHARNL